MIRSTSTMFAAVFAVTTLVAGCGRQAPAPSQTEQQTQPTGTAADTQYDTAAVTLTGCVQRGAGNEYVLANVANAGVMPSPEAPADGNQQGTANERANQARSWTAPDSSTTESTGQMLAASTYRLVPGDEDLSEYVDKRVAIRGRLSPDVATGTSGTAAQQSGQQVSSDATGATVAGSAPPLRGFYVGSVRKVADSCTR